MRLDRRTAATIPGTLFHYTAAYHFESILGQKVLTTTESNISFTGAGPRVCWLTDVDASTHGWAAGGGKGEVRFTIRTAGLPIFWWPDWSSSQDIESWWYDALAKAGGGNPQNWYVCTEPIGIQHWTDIEVWQGSGFKSVLGMVPE